MSDRKQTEEVQKLMNQNLTEDEMNERINQMIIKETPSYNKHEEWTSYGSLSDEREEFDIDNDMS